MKKRHPGAATAAAALPLTSDIALDRIRTLWPLRFRDQYLDDAHAALRQWQTAQLGHEPTRISDEARLAKIPMTSLPLIWASLWRPLGGGRAGIDQALGWSRLDAPVLQAGLRRLARARGVYVECMAANGLAGTLVLRDLFSGDIYHIENADANLLVENRRWRRGYTVVVEIGDGRFSYSSTFTMSDALAALPPERFIELAQEALVLCGLDANGIDPAAPHAGLRTYCGIAWSAIDRWLRELPPPPPPRHYLVNGENERIEFQDAVIALDEGAAVGLMAALARAGDFIRTEHDSWCWVSRGPTVIHRRGESLADLFVTERALRVSTTSPGRLERLRDRLAQLLGARPVVSELKVTLPWETQTGVVAEPGPDVKTVALSTGSPVMGVRVEEARGKADDLLLDGLRHTLEQKHPRWDGTARKAIKTPAGRAAVEAWLRGAEAAGRPATGDGSPRDFLDLDVLREELGLPTVRDQITRGRGGR